MTSHTPSTSASSATLVNSPRTPTMSENTPLLNKRAGSVSSSRSTASGRVQAQGDTTDTEAGGKAKEVDVYVPGKSTFTQTVVNTIGDLLGQGILATPIAFAYSGWIMGPFLMLMYAALTLWTLKLLARIIEKDRRLRNFAEVIGYGLGPTAQNMVGLVFVVEIVIWIVALVVVSSDSFNAVMPFLSSRQWKLVDLIFLVPMSFLPLRYVAYASGLGAFATASLVGILIFSGITTAHSPGSIRDPAPTDFLPTHGFIKFGTTIGLFIAGFGGHGLIPNLIADMKQPEYVDQMCDTSYGIVMVIYLVVAVFGYLMYGRNVSDQVSKDLARTPGFTPLLNKLAVWTTAVNALCKVPLGNQPLADVLFTQFKLHPTVLLPSTAVAEIEHADPSSPLIVASEPVLDAADAPDQVAASELEGVSPTEEAGHERRERLKWIGRQSVRLVLSILPTIIAIYIPSFESLLSFLGSGFAIIMSIIIPVWAKASVFGWKWHEKALCVFSAVLCVVGVICSVWPSHKGG